MMKINFALSDDFKMSYLGLDFCGISSLFSEIK
jgi:hypothetical protein